MASPYNTGIQRVVRNIVREAGVVSSALGYECVPVAFSAGGFRPLMAGAESASTTKLGWKSRLLERAVWLDRLLSRLPLAGLYQKLRQVLLGLLHLLKRSVAPASNVDQAACPAGFRSGHCAGQSPDVLLLLDSTWDMQMWTAVDEFRASGGHVCAVLYDLIPFSHPETVEDHTRKMHTTWWSEAPLHLDGVACISQTVREQYLAWQAERQLARQLPPEQVTYFYLGSELSDGATEANDRFAEIGDPSVPYYLVVGSIEPRKNHALILDAFEMLWNEGKAVNLVIVGGHGWKCESMLDRIYGHPMFNKRLFLIRQASDAELGRLYGNAAALVFASIAEGFGLPIVEAYQRGARVICSDIPVFREIAGDRAGYFNPADPASLAEAIAKDGELAPRRQSAEADMAWLTWRESAEQLLTRILELADKAH